MKKVYASFLFFLLSFCLSGCSGKNSALDEIGRSLGLNLSSGTLLSSEDSRGGFHGDGISITVIQFPDDSIAAAAEAAGWSPLPPDETVQALLYGYEFDDGTYGPYLTDKEGEPLLPAIENGYYYLKDRPAEPGKATGADILHRGSFNFSIAVYDSDTEILYYCEMDT